MSVQFTASQKFWLFFWVVPSLVFIILAQLSHVSLLGAATPLPALQVYSNAENYRVFEKATEFSLEKIYSVVNYMLLAAAGVLVFVSKTLIELRTERARLDSKSHALRPTAIQLTLTLHVAIACVFSIVWGVIACLSLPDIAFVASFDVSGSLGTYVVGQAAGLVAAAVLLLVALGGVVRDLLP